MTLISDLLKRWYLSRFRDGEIERLNYHLKSTRVRMLELEQQRDDYLNREWVSHKALLEEQRKALKLQAQIERLTNEHQSTNPPD